MRLDAAIADATTRLTDSSDSPRLDAEILLCQTIDMPRSYLFAHPEDELDDLTKDRFETLLRRRINGEPMSYITGTKEFWSHELLVSPATLVPLGTGSGAIAISIAAERVLSTVTATDISPDALAIAAENVRQADLANVSCIVGSWTEPVAGQRFDIIVSNPPYVREGDEALQNLRHEPLSALASGADGLDDIRVLATDCGAILAADGWLMLEHGADQQTEVADILGTAGWVEIACHNDLTRHQEIS